METEYYTPEESKEIAKRYKDLLRESYQTLSEEDKRLIRKAFDVAVDAHKEQRRKSGELYIYHPIAVAKIVAYDIGLDAVSIASALLHDVVEDTPITIEEIAQQFGDTIAKIVKGLTKISDLSRDTDVSFQAENFRKMLLTLNDDVRVILIKIADRLHNMQTMDAMPTYKQQKIASETLFIYAPGSEVYRTRAILRHTEQDRRIQRRATSIYKRILRYGESRLGQGKDRLLYQRTT